MPLWKGNGKVLPVRNARRDKTERIAAKRSNLDRVSDLVGNWVDACGKNDAAFSASIEAVIAPINAATCDLALKSLNNSSAYQMDVDSIRTNGGSVLIKAVQLADAEMVMALIAVGADVNAVDLDGNTPLMFATCSGFVSIVEVLIAVGADVNAKNNAGCTAITWAMKDSNCADPESKGTLIALLVEAGAEIDAGTCERAPYPPNAIIGVEVRYGSAQPDAGRHWDTCQRDDE